MLSCKRCGKFSVCEELRRNETRDGFVRAQYRFGVCPGIQLPKTAIVLDAWQQDSAESVGRFYCVGNVGLFRREVAHHFAVEVEALHQPFRNGEERFINTRRIAERETK